MTGSFAGLPQGATFTASYNATTYNFTVNYAGGDGNDVVLTTVSTTTSAINASTITYGTNGLVTVTVSSSGGTPTGNVSLTVDSGTPMMQVLSGGSSTFTISGLDAGVYSLTANYVAQGTFAGSYATGTLTVIPADLAMYATSDSKVYDGTDCDSAVPTFQVANEPLDTLYNSDTLTGLVQVFDSQNVMGPNGSTLQVQAGYSVNDGDGGADYTVTTYTASGTITTLAASVTPNAASKVYGSADPTLTGTLSGFLAGDDVTATYSRTAGQTVLGWPYTISATLSPASVLSNYNITYNTASFTITTLAASVTPNAATKVYGSADPTLTGTLSGFLAGDDVTATYSRTAGETVLGGPYTVSATLSPASVLSNYNITYNTAGFTITALAASVTPNAASKVYGSVDPTLTGTLSGFLAGDDVTATCNRTAGQTVLGGPYTISATLSPANVLSNYNITYNTASFTITALAASVTPNAASKVYGSVDPTLTGALRVPRGR